MIHTTTPYLQADCTVVENGMEMQDSINGTAKISEGGKQWPGVKVINEI